MSLRIAVLMGGRSKERDVSLKSGQSVAEALRKKGYEVEAIDVDQTLPAQLAAFKPDAAFVALHGKYGEDGTIQGLLEIMDIPYTGAGVACSAVCMNKITTKKIMIYEGIPTAPFVVFDRMLEHRSTEELAQIILTEIGVPVVIKPATQGSTIGTSIVKDASVLVSALDEAFAFDKQVLAEKFIAGVEVSQSILGNESPVLLPLIEVTTESGVYDYHSKYTPGASAHVIPARTTEEITRRVGELTLKACRAFECRGAARVDFIIDSEGNPWALEVNTSPGMTPVSLYPDAARHHGLSYEELVVELLNLGLVNWKNTR